MTVWRNGQSGTIGGGALEFTATQKALQQLETKNKSSKVEQVPLGPGLGQCCGGSVTLLTEKIDKEVAAQFKQNSIDNWCVRPFDQANFAEPPPPINLDESVFDLLIEKGWIAERVAKPRRSIWIYGAGHVGRAIVDVLSPLPVFGIVWADIEQERFPTVNRQNVDKLVATNLSRTVAHAPKNAEHLVMTHSHSMDLEICAAILGRPFKSAGLIGSTTKWARFRKRLIEAGHLPQIVDQIRCPIGDVSLGKHPHAIAIGVAAKFLSIQQSQPELTT